MDIDHFKGINDTHGHAVGDLILQCLASVLKQTTRHMDLAGRCGGDEFVILLPETGIEEASVDGFLKRLTRSSRSTYPSNGEGLDLRFEGDRISGAALVCQGEIIHLSAYALSSTS